VNKDKLYLIYIEEYINRVEQYTQKGKNTFFKDIKTQDAVLRNLHTLSESIRRLSPQIKTKYPEVDWRSIVAFRNVVVHDYLSIDLNLIWDIIERDLPNLKNMIEIIKQEIGGETKNNR